jgi:hypothetical protein
MKREPIDSNSIILATFPIKIASALLNVYILKIRLLTDIFSKRTKDESFDSKLAAQVNPILCVTGNSFCNTHISPSQFISATTDKFAISSFVYALVDSMLRCPKTSETHFSEWPELTSFDAQACLRE